MGGIAGWVQWDTDVSAQKHVLQAMSETLARRGPDDGGIWTAQHAGVVSRRLAVVAPDAGHQPMVGRRGEQLFVLTYNGELYNAEELRRELRSRGYNFQSLSDTEVLLCAYMEWGPACLDRLNGMFAFAVWDSRNDRLFLARDRIGVKPLFYARRGRGLIFGSELKALLAHPSIEPEVELEGLAEVFVTAPMRTPGHGVFRGVEELRPAHYLIFDREGLRISRYWSLESRPHTDDLETTVTRIRELLRDTVERHLVADVPVCTLLSGGIDSSGVTGFAASTLERMGKEPLDTYSVDYAGNEEHFRPSSFQPNSDAPYVDIVTDHFATRHHRVVIETNDLIEALSAAVHARDLPGMADIDSSLYLFCRTISTNHRVAISGEAADEVFGGYPWLYNEKALNRDGFPWVRMLEIRSRILSPELAEKLSPREYMQERYREALAEVPHLPGEEGKAARLREINYLNLARFGAALLERKDRMSSAVGLEARVPYCDHRLIEYVWNIPWELKTVDNREKGLLRRALRGIVPSAVVERRKSPYPKTHNPEYLTAVRDRLLQVLEDPHSPLRDLINTEAVGTMAENAGSIELPFWGQLMTGPQLLAYLLQVDIWMREYRVTLR